MNWTGLDAEAADGFSPSGRVSSALSARSSVRDARCLMLAAVKAVADAVRSAAFMIAITKTRPKVRGAESWRVRVVDSLLSANPQH